MLYGDLDASYLWGGEGVRCIVGPLFHRGRSLPCFVVVEAYLVS